MPLPDLTRVEILSRAEWRDWLVLNHTQLESIWLVTWKKASGEPHVPYAAIVEEALCFGWIDSRPAKLDDKRTMLLLSPRRRRSAWSALNKRRVADLLARGLIAPPGLAKIEQARADGTWTFLDDLDTVPDDLTAALQEHPEAELHFLAFSPSSRRGILEWIRSAKQPATRARRITETATLAARNVKANQPKPR